MTLLQKCDRCGKIADNWCGVITICIQHSSSKEPKFDLCNKCYTSLLRWMSRKRGSFSVKKISNET